MEKKSSAPSVYNPFATAAQSQKAPARHTGPPVYRPNSAISSGFGTQMKAGAGPPSIQPGGLQRRQLPTGAPPVYKPQPTSTQSKFSTAGNPPALASYPCLPRKLLPVPSHSGLRRVVQLDPLDDWKAAVKRIAAGEDFPGPNEPHPRTLIEMGPFQEKHPNEV